MPGGRIDRRGFLAGGVSAAVAVALGRTASARAAAPAPTGLTAFALDGRVALAWLPVAGAAGYVVRRGTDGAAPGDVVSPADLAATTWVDPTAPNGTACTYVVTADGGPPSLPARATPAARAAGSDANAVARENRFPGDPGWMLQAPTDAGHNGIEGFCSATSVAAGASVELKVSTSAAGVPFRVEVHRTGWYGGARGRLVGVLPGRTGTLQGLGLRDATTGLRDCSGWSTSATICTTEDWPSGVYLLRLVREDSGRDNHVLLVVRDDAGSADVLCALPVTTYQAYNNYGGRSLYDSNSTGTTTQAGTPRATQVSFDRPYQQSVTKQRNFFTFSDVQGTSWLEAQGYDVAYATSVDLHARPEEARRHRALVSPAHDEYWSQAMRDGVTAARDAGTSLLWLGSNAVYWRVRIVPSPVSGAADRVVCCAKTTQGGPVDPVSPTGTWRDATGAAASEHTLVGQRYVGDNDSVFFRLAVTAAQGRTAPWRHTGLAALADGAATTVGRYLVGWEWDARVGGADDPPGLVVHASSPVTGQVLLDDGRLYQDGASTRATVVSYPTAAGGLVFATGTNHWVRGLGTNVAGVGEPSAVIAQATLNVLLDMGARPATPAAGLVVDGAPAPQPPRVVATSPADGATGVDRASDVRASLDRDADPATVAGALLLRTADGTALPGTTTWSAATRAVVLTPAAPLPAGATLTATLTTDLRGADGTALAAPVAWTFAVAAPVTPSAPTITGVDPPDGAAAVGARAAFVATATAALDPASLTAATVGLERADGTAIAHTATYAPASRTVTLVPTAPLPEAAAITARIGAGVAGIDGTPLAAPRSWTATTAAASSLLGATAPAKVRLPVKDGRAGAGPFSYELGMEVRVTSPSVLLALRAWRDGAEPGPLLATVWSAGGAVLAQLPLPTAGTTSGWVQADLPAPLALEPGRTYVVSVAIRASFVMTQGALAAELSAGVLRSVADGTNGVFGATAGTFPQSSYKSSCYFVDCVAR